MLGFSQTPIQYTSGDQMIDVAHQQIQSDTSITTRNKQPIHQPTDLRSSPQLPASLPQVECTLHTSYQLYTPTTTMAEPPAKIPQHR